MVTLIFEPHATTIDNEARQASGWNDIPLSELGKKQAIELGQRYKLKEIDAVFTSDLARAYTTAQLAFPDITPQKLHMDWRLRECDYGELTQHAKEAVDAEKPKRITTPFPQGESYEQTTERMRSFVADLLRLHDNQTIMIIGHRATQYGLEHLVNHIPLDEVVIAPWKWQPGWTYTFTAIQ